MGTAVRCEAHMLRLRQAKESAEKSRHIGSIRQVVGRLSRRINELQEKNRQLVGKSSRSDLFPTYKACATNDNVTQSS
jgi:hypothetical protein